MGKGHMELVLAHAIAAVAGGSAATAPAGFSLTVKNGKEARLLNFWTDVQTAGFTRLTSPSMHDQTLGYQVRQAVSDTDLRMPMGLGLDLTPQEDLAVTISGAATAGDVETFAGLMYYEELGGVSAASRGISWEEFKKRRAPGGLVTIPATITAAGATGGVSGEELITAESNLLKANEDYAVLGCITSVECAALTMRGPDTGNVHIAVPGNEIDIDMMAGFFLLMARAHDLPIIPVINSGNRASTYIGCVQDENAAAVACSWILHKLK